LARSDDAPEIARLASELGYQTEAGEMRWRIEMIGANPDHGAFVAQRNNLPMEAIGGAPVGRSDGPIQGWVHVVRRILLESGESAEIVGLVVEPSARRGGVGRRLVVAAEEWSRALGLDRIIVRSNSVREEPHRFYPALDFALTKTQRVYIKRLG
jgi:GNAT superfamily N-acetyltransferase